MSRKLAPLDFTTPSPRRERPGTVPLTFGRNNGGNGNNGSSGNHHNYPHFIPDSVISSTGSGRHGSSSSTVSVVELANSRGVSFRIPNSSSANAISTQDLSGSDKNSSSSSILRSVSAASNASETFAKQCLSNSNDCHSQQPSSADFQRLKSKSMDEIGVLKISNNEIYDFGVKDLQDLGQIGAGSFGTVNKMQHVKSRALMAVKIIRVSMNEEEQRKVVMDLGVIRKASYQHIVTFHGALFHEGDCWICMELMDLSAEILYRYVHHFIKQFIPEPILAQIALATVRALMYLKNDLKIIHRDVKPSNILINRHGNIKLCDFGISGVLVDSIARTHDVGCRPYMAPERIDPRYEKDGYDIRSDVWSMGISLIEISTGSFPYRSWNSVFDQLQEVVTGTPPKLKDMPPKITFTANFHRFIDSCLQKERKDRPKYSGLLKSSFLERAAHDEHTDVKGWMEKILEKTKEVPLPHQNR